jgi:hypothetical protein
MESSDMDKNNLREIYERASTAELEEIISFHQDEYFPETIAVIKDILSKRDDRTIGITEKICPYCKKFILTSHKICTCGYNFSRPNITKLETKKKKDAAYQRTRGAFNILRAILVFILGIIVYFILILFGYNVPKTFFVIFAIISGAAGFLSEGFEQLITGKKSSSEKDIEAQAKNEVKPDE